MWLLSQILSSVSFWILVGKCFNLLTQPYFLSLLISFINTFHRYFNIYHRYKILYGIPSVYLLYSWKFAFAGLRIQPKKETTSLFTSICLPLKDWLCSPRNHSRSGEVCSGLLLQMLRGPVIKSLLFCESHVYICLTFIPHAACVPIWVCGFLQVTG